MSVFPAAFARLQGKKPAATRAAEDEKDEKKDDDKAKSKAEEDDEDKKKDDEKDEDKKSKAQGDDDDENDAEAESDKDDECGDEKKDGKKSKAQTVRRATRGDDDAGDRADALDPQASIIRARERGRIAAILSSEVAQANPGAAVYMAMETQMSRNDAIGTLMASAAPARPATAALRDRMQTVNIPAVGAGDVSRGTPTLAEQVILAGKKRRGEI